jgi:rod shape-determining protein MreD
LSLFRSNEPTGVRVNTRSASGEAPLIAPAWPLAALFLIAGLLLQIEVLPFLQLRGAELSIVLVVVVWYALHSDLRRAALFGLIAGLCEDALSAQTGAAWTISTTLTAAAVSLLSRWFFADSIPAAAAVTVVATLLRRMLFWVTMALFGYPPGYARLHLHQALWEALLNACFIAAAMLVARHLEARASR